MISFLEEADWIASEAAHAQAIDRLTADRLRRASRHEKHPVEDFLFEYYSFRPAQLRRWHPGVGVVLRGHAAERFLANPSYTRTGNGVVAGRLAPEREPGTRWILRLLEQTALRPGFYGCHGLHEWAMVYKSDAVRHSAWPLRLSRSEIEEFVESHGLRCSHFDAFRFFTEPARPLNRLQPSRTTSADFELPSCLHANMDLYKWAYKLSPFTASELVLACFQLAREAREIDMRASPYDFTAIGRQPIPIETPTGREEYERQQRRLAAKAQPLREKLAATCRTMLSLPRILAATASALALSLSGCATPTLSDDALPVVELMAARLEVAKDVAWIKRVENLPVRDAVRERAVVDRFVAQAESVGFEPGPATRFIRAQIEASCLQQEWWLSQWNGNVSTPPGEPPPLERLRARLDSLSARLLAEWAAVEANPPAAAAVRAELISKGFSPAASTAAATAFR